MAVFKADKVISSLPGTLTADTFYCVRVGTGFDFYLSDSTGLTAHKINPIPNGQVELNPQTGTAYTLALTDAGKVVPRNNAAANTTTVPSNASVAFPIGTIISVTMRGAGVSSIVAAAGVTINDQVAKTAAISARYTGVTLIKEATNVWTANGNIGAFV